MKRLILFTLSLFTTTLVFAQRDAIFYDTLGKVTTFETHWSQVVGGRYKTTYDKKTKERTLARTTDKEFKEALLKTEKRIITKEKLGTDFPAFQTTDIDGNTFSMRELLGKVIVINFWFIGCSPCEMERPELNGLAKLYEANKDVVFISFARNDKEQLRSFLPEHPFNFNPIPTGKDEIKTKFEVNSYPVNVVVDKDGRYAFYGTGTGIGISQILKGEIDAALKK